jgi:hypothetical protein
VLQLLSSVSIEPMIYIAIEWMPAPGDRMIHRQCAHHVGSDAKMEHQSDGYIIVRYNGSYYCIVHFIVLGMFLILVLSYSVLEPFGHYVCEQMDEYQQFHHVQMHFNGRINITIKMGLNLLSIQVSY